MQFSEVKALFSSILNRRDITPSLISQFISLGNSRVGRQLRVPAMEQLTIYTMDGAASTFAVPAGLVELIAIYTNDGTNENKLEQVDLQTVLRASRNPASPTVYCRIGSNYQLGGVPGNGDSIYVNYYAAPADLSADTDTNWLTLTCPSVLVYAALIYAADYFMDDRKPMWEATFQSDLADVQWQVDRDQMVNATISPAYPPVDCYP